MDIYLKTKKYIYPGESGKKPEFEIPANSYEFNISIFPPVFWASTEHNMKPRSKHCLAEWDRGEALKLWPKEWKRELLKFRENAGNSSGFYLLLLWSHSRGSDSKGSPEARVVDNGNLQE